MNASLRNSALAALAMLVVASARAEAPALEAFFRDFTAEWIRANPNQATATRYFSGAEQDELERRLTPLTAAWRRSRAELARRGLDELARLERAGMSAPQRASAELMRWQLTMIVEAQRYDDYSFPLQQQGGANVSLVNALTVAHPLATEKDAENYLARLAQVAGRMHEAIAEARQLAGKRMTPPRFIVRATIAQMQQFLAVPAGQNPFVALFAERMAEAKRVPAERIAALRASAERIVELEVYPAWRAAVELLESLARRASEDAGLWRFAGGGEAYAHHLRRNTTTPLTAAEIHAIGLREVARIEKEMERILQGLGRTQGSVKERLANLAAEQRYPDAEESRTVILADLDAMLRDAERRAAALFDLRPRAAVIVRPHPRFREASAAASYSSPPLDGSRPGIFHMPLRTARMTRFGLRSLVYHETVPGHHFQLALEIENDAQPRFRRIRAFGGIPAFGEGWALYAERLAAEAGWYDGDPVGLLGQLDYELFRARRLVVDTGIHAMRWTREQAIAYGIGPSEVDRYVVNPGQACAYMLGMLKILELRDRAKAKLGERFSLKRFHNAVLATGTVPLELLEQEVDAYIRSGQ